MYRTNIDLGPELRARYKVSEALIAELNANLYYGPDGSSINWSKGLARLRAILEDIPELYYNAETGEILEDSQINLSEHDYYDFIHWVDVKREIAGKGLASYV